MWPRLADPFYDQGTPNLDTTIVAPEDFDQGAYLAELSPEGDQLWQDVWTQFKVAAKG